MSFNMLVVGAVGCLSLVGSTAGAAPKYYFELREVKGGEAADPEVRTYASEALAAELKARTEFTGDLGGAKGDDAIAAEAKKRKLRAFSVSLRLDKVGKQVKDPKPGGRLKRLEVGVKVSVFGTTLPGEKLAFSGEGEAGLESEVADRGIDKEAVSLQKDAMKDAIKQAVEQAVLKLSLPKSVPLNESKRKKKK